MYILYRHFITYIHVTFVYILYRSDARYMYNERACEMRSPPRVNAFTVASERASSSRVQSPYCVEGHFPIQFESPFHAISHGVFGFGLRRKSFNIVKTAT